MLHKIHCTNPAICMVKSRLDVYEAIQTTKRPNVAARRNGIKMLDRMARKRNSYGRRLYYGADVARIPQLRCVMS